MNAVARTERQRLGKTQNNKICHSTVQFFIAIHLIFEFNVLQSLRGLVILLMSSWLHKWKNLYYEKTNCPSWDSKKNLPHKCFSTK